MMNKLHLCMCTVYKDYYRSIYEEIIKLIQVK